MAKWHHFMVIQAFILSFVPIHVETRNGKDLILSIDDLKEYKKVLRTKTNLLIIFAKSAKSASDSMSLFGEVAMEMRGKATLALVDCSNAKKLCKNAKTNPSKLELKHFKDGEFNKDYDRKMAKKSMVNFLLDPTGDIPWEEEPTATDVIHIDTPQSFNKLLRKEKNPMLVMFYAPWCGFCKRLKPDFSAAATEMKGKAVLVGIDVDKPHQMELRSQFNITGFPTLYYFEKGQKKYQYGGENNKEGIISWLNDPKPPTEKKAEAEWSDEESDVQHITDSNYEDILQANPSVLVMFYAPFKYFKNGEFAFDFNEREEDKIIEFMKDPKEPPPPPPPEPKWDEVESEVVHLTDDSFKNILKKKKHALVMFYAPWCGHCKKAKPEFTNAAEKYKDDTKVMFAAIDCTTQSSSCSTHEVTGYPTFKYFKYGKNPQNYMGGREEADFVNFMKDPQNPGAVPTPPPAEPPEKQWADSPGFENLHFLTDSNFDTFMQSHPSILVMFYAPWESFESSYNDVCMYISQLGHMPSPKEPPPPPPPEPAWSSVPSEVKHLSDKNFTSYLKDKKAALIMFYAPWCGHCKKTKPDFQKAADVLKKADTDKILGAVDCTTERDICGKENIQGFPTFKLYTNGKFLKEYNNDRTEEEFIKFIKNAPVLDKEEL
ncbi:hypothetical protein KUTeg_015388 [Tegillarca granosa]|uniref:Thioredoxin domain-containing protein n=1 Tax=Tegillarca granosa TaxID=220873 RepID=A0ABQ9EQL5_TEGGR|nr:hypothetical protein KUTeg_015388 [Tegillarca granosa]